MYPQAMRRCLGTLLLGLGLLIGLTSHVSAQSFPARVGVGAAPNENYIDLYYPYEESITPITFPEATGGTGTLTYDLDGGYESLGLTFDADTRVLSGSPNLAGAGPPSGNYWGFPGTYSVEDQSGGFASVTVYLTICEGAGIAAGTTACSAPAFVEFHIPPPPPQIYVVDQPITSITLLEASGGTGTNPLRFYRLTGLPAGLTFDAISRVLSGTPTAIGTSDVTYRVHEAATLGELFESITGTIQIVDSVTVPTLADQTYPAGPTITDLTLPVAIGGVSPYTYALTEVPGEVGLGGLGGLAFDAPARVLHGAPTIAGTTTVIYTITDSTATTVRGTFDITITGPMFSSEPDNQTYSAGTAITALTLPVATGRGTLNYVLTGPNFVNLSEVPGLTFDDTTRVLSGTPTTAGTTTLYYTVTDSLNNATDITFTVTVARTLSTVNDQFYSVGVTIDTLTLPVATGGGTLTYTLTGPNGIDLSEVPGLTFDATSRELSGVPTIAEGTTLTYAATSAGGSPVTNTFFVTVTGPTLTGLTNQSYPAGTPIPDLTLPTGTGFGILTYTLTDLNEVPGLTFDAISRVLSGTPTIAGVTTELTYTITDPHGNSAVDTFTVEITGPTLITDPTDQSYTVDTAITDLTLPAVDSTSDPGVATYTLTGTLPTGLSYNADTRILSGTPTVAGTTTLTYGFMISGGTNTRTFSVTVNPAPFFTDEPAPIPYATAAPIPDLTLPAAMGGTGMLTYTLTGPNGADLSEVPELTFDEDTRVLSGTPTTAADAIELTYTAMADLGNAIANFDIEVVERAVFYTPPTNQELARYQWTYNHYRPHDSLDLMTPMAYYQHLTLAT